MKEQLRTEELMSIERRLLSETAYAQKKLDSLSEKRCEVEEEDRSQSEPHELRGLLEGLAEFNDLLYSQYIYGQRV